MRSQGGILVQHITLDGQRKATIKAPDPGQPAIQVLGREVTIKGFTVIGGSFGIAINKGPRAQGTALSTRNPQQDFRRGLVAKLRLKPPSYCALDGGSSLLVARPLPRPRPRQIQRRSIPKNSLYLHGLGPLEMSSYGRSALSRRPSCHPRRPPARRSGPGSLSVFRRFAA